MKPSRARARAEEIAVRWHPYGYLNTGLAEEIEQAINTAVSEALSEVAECVEVQFDVETETGGEEELQAVRQKILELKGRWAGNGN